MIVSIHQWVSLLVLGLGLNTLAQASFSIYDGLDSLIVQTAYGLSDQCLQALNSTISCDQALGGDAAGGPDELCIYSFFPSF